MSLEEAIKDNTQALYKLIRILDKQFPDRETEAAPKMNKEEAPDPAAKIAAKKAPAAGQIEESVEPSAVTEKVSSSEAASTELTYNDVAKAIVALSKKNLQDAKDVLSRFGVKNGKELKPEQWADAKALAESVLAGDDA